jgi:hypothetical protein
MAAGVGVLIGPTFATRFLYPTFGNARLPQGVNAVVMGALAAFVALTLRETLDVGRRKPMEWSRANPLSFFRMLTTSRTMFCWMFTSLLQTFIDGRNITESNFVYMQQELSFDEKGLSNYQSFAGIKIFVGGFLGKPMMKAFGQLGLTTASNFINCIAQTLAIVASGPNLIYAHIFATGIGERKRDGVETLLLSEGERHGFGRGEFAAGMANFRSLANIMSPLLFAWVYNWSVSLPRRLPMLLFVSRMVVGAILPELFFRLVPLQERLACVDRSEAKKR